MDIKYYAPQSLEEALSQLETLGEEVKILAGGTDVVPRLNYYEVTPSALIYIEGLGLNYIRESDGKIIIGASTTWTEIIENPVVNDSIGVLSDAARLGGTKATRNAGTIGGNIANASPAADLIPPLLVMEAELLLASKNEERIIAVKDFFIGPGKTQIKPTELIKEVHIPLYEGVAKFQKLGRRKAMTLSVVNAAVRLDFKEKPGSDSKECVKALIAIGSVAPTPMRCLRAERILVGKELNASLIWECANEALNEANPIDDQRATAWYRNKAGATIVARALAHAATIQID